MKKLIALLICLTFAFSCLSVQAAAAGCRVKERILYYIDEEGCFELLLNIYYEEIS